MRFINPRTDFAFKKIFGSDRSKGVLMSFLNAILEYKGSYEIVDLDILNPREAPKIKGMKDTYLDVKVKTKTGKYIIIEMQVLNVDGLEKRVLYNAAKNYSSQLVKGDEYKVLNPVVALTIVDFIMFKESDKYINTFVLKEKADLFDYKNKDLELVFVELPKFTKTKVSELQNIQEKRIYFLKESDGLAVAPKEFTDKRLKEAFEMGAEINMTFEELDIIEKKAMRIHDQKKALLDRKEFLLMKKSLEKSIKEAKDTGIKAGVEQGIKQGVEQGIKQGVVKQDQMIENLMQKQNISRKEAEAILL